MQKMGVMDPSRETKMIHPKNSKTYLFLKFYENMGTIEFTNFIPTWKKITTPKNILKMILFLKFYQNRKKIYLCKHFNYFDPPVTPKNPPTPTKTPSKTSSMR